MSGKAGGGRLRLMGGAVLALVLAVGGLGGAAIARMVAPAAAEVERDECARFRQERRRPFDDLGLTAEQAQRIDAVLEKRRDQMDEFWKTNRPRMDSIVNGTRAELMDILTPEQRAENDSRNARRREERRALEERCAQKDQGNGDRHPDGDGPARRSNDRSERNPPAPQEMRA